MNNIGIAINPSKDADNKILNMVVKKFKEKFNLKNIEVFNSFDIEDQNLRDIDLLIVLGGDGTLLGIARSLNDSFNAPILGINIGNLGFLSSVDISDIDIALEKLKDGKYKFVDRMMLNCKVESDENKEELKALNDVVLARGTLSRMVKFTIFVDGKIYSTFKGDGLIIATPTGSTAYSFSAGGPFIYPDLELITITPICPHTKSMQTIVLKGDSIIEIYADHEEEKIYLTVDGQKAIKINHETSVKVSKNKKSVKLLVFDDYDYFKVLRSKILNNSKECDGEKL
ncbi:MULTISPECIES: NAD(+)/NADH kinase [Clostridium]|uniref:NAD kinase n=1 Tax=Clostridium beijerinckii TaxID=1520 RepID=A0A1S9NAL5_CLOBE|nr:MULTISPECIES: NAD(+)/NADH kinase [Clostridium]MBN7572646.1 NAD(+)/NADH kinase [Clostridium beijerinckii]MBN7577986.1 NAD(+)/NADH kinase [Clostridium beijerinckii]MBN7582419.1 NAD(+)/NADH kinase [Clostridium beijerinckii]MBO0519547.1 NAD(+)/NADH kinase [Clostridium beijerinckii]MZK48855.1 NAD(+) kinase [Clostridium beijerinckii]